MRAYLQLSGILFALVALGHLVRTLARWPLLIAGYPLPAIVSLGVAVVAGGLSIWAWRLLTEPLAAVGSASKPPPAA